MTSLKGANAAPTAGSIRLVVRELGMAYPARAVGSRSLDSTRRSHARPGRSGELAAGGSQAGVWSIQKGGIQNGERQNWSNTHRKRKQTLESAVLGNLQAAFGGGPGEKGWLQSLACGLSYFIVTAASTELLEQEVKPLVKAFLKERGLQLSSEKTRITHIEEGFDFLGQNIRKYKTEKGHKLLIKPARRNVHAHLEKIREV